MNNELNELVAQVLNLDIPASQLRPEVMALKTILLNVSDFNACPDEGIASGETTTQYGLAISPSNAAMCTDDYVRTVQFIRGAHQAIQSVYDQGVKKVHLLYVGCGPLAILLIPLVIKFKGQKVRFTVVDIHQESIQSVNAILHALSLDNKTINLICGDAMNCVENLPEPPDVVLVEVMQAGLKTEPQVAVCRQVMQNYPHALMVPESIKLSIKWVDPNIEFSQFTKNRANFRRNLGTAFTIDKKAIAGWSDKETSVIPAANIDLPDDLDHTGVLQIFTEIDVFKGLLINEYQSGLTTPLNLNINLLESSGKQMHFEYSVLNNPGLNIRK